MRCPKCNALQARGKAVVLEVRRKQKGTITRRTRQCICGHKFCTYEQLATIHDHKSGGAHKITNYQKQMIFEKRDWYTSTELAELFGVHVSTIRDIKRKYGVYTGLISKEKIK